MAYCPLAHGDIPHKPVLKRIAERHRATPAQIMLAWVLRHEHVIAIPKSSRPERVRENVAAADIVLSAEDLMDLDKRLPAAAQAAAAGDVVTARRDVPMGMVTIARSELGIGAATV